MEWVYLILALISVALIMSIFFIRIQHDRIESIEIRIARLFEDNTRRVFEIRKLDENAKKADARLRELANDFYPPMKLGDNTFRNYSHVFEVDRECSIGGECMPAKNLSENINKQNVANKLTSRSKKK